MRSMTPSDPVNHPSHYTRTSLETIDVIEDMVKGWPSASAYRLGNVLKYIWRHRDKGDPKENLKKALWYLQRELDALLAEQDLADAGERLSLERTSARAVLAGLRSGVCTNEKLLDEKLLVKVAKPLEQRSIVVEPLPPEQHNNISAFSRVKHLGEVGTVMALGLEQAEVVFHNGQRRWVPIADLELA